MLGAQSRIEFAADDLEIFNHVGGCGFGIDTDGGWVVSFHQGFKHMTMADMIHPEFMLSTRVPGDLSFNPAGCFRPQSLGLCQKLQQNKSQVVRRCWPSTTNTRPPTVLVTCSGNTRDSAR